MKNGLRRSWDLEVPFLHLTSKDTLHYLVNIFNIYNTFISYTYLIFRQKISSENKIYTLFSYVYENIV